MTNYREKGTFFQNGDVGFLDLEVLSKSRLHIDFADFDYGTCKRNCVLNSIWC